MFPIVSKKRRVDEETGQVVEGKFNHTRALTLWLLTALSLDWDMVFADDEREAHPTTFKFLQMAHAWSQAKKSGQTVPPSALLSGVPQAQRPSTSPEKVSAAAHDDGDDASSVASSNGGD